MILRLTLLAALVSTSALAAPDSTRWDKHRAAVTITRDDFGIPHIKGKTDADAVFGMIYAQAEDDFNRVETNFINAQGRLAETEGQSAIWRDLRMKLFIDPAELKAQYAASPAWLKSLSTAWADALNYYLATHPAVKPRVITHFEPWMALSFSEGSIGGDIESINLANLEALHTGQPAKLTALDLGSELAEPLGSNGMALAPARSTSGDALLLINPHTSFYFRSEAKVESGQGLDAYGASTWGQFFVYQGFNRHVGWMHTSSGVDNIDEFALTVERKGGKWYYLHGTTWKPLAEKRISVPYKAADGTLQTRNFTTYSSHHGPIIRAENGKWIAVSLMHRPVAALEQSFLRTKTHDLASYLQVASRRANSSNATLFASSKGEIAYLHPQFVPVRDAKFNWKKPVDGSDPATDWQGEHSLDQLPSVANPGTGFVFNVNNWPWTAAGKDSPKQAAFPRYMDYAGENPRGPNALRLLSGDKKFDLPALLTTAYDPFLQGFADTIPPLVKAWDALPAGAQKDRLAAPIAALKSWDYRTGEASVPTSLAVFWGDEMIKRFGPIAKLDEEAIVPYLASASVPDADRLAALDTAIARLAGDFGGWDTPWGHINRFQRLNGAIAGSYDDKLPSTPIGFASGNWGSLASFGAGPSVGTKRWYGSYGNSFVAVVRFGKDGPEARAVHAGGLNSNPASPHFRDQAERYRTHAFRSVYLTDAQLQGHVEKTYRPGQ
ncbi:penicillin acylase family protein [Sandarakinorhabdus limnophila]|uniref:penicillin acylase family protein n=1 Tax=Sandarakinorhabdus limnophila TaxID=210512 RepID=UPI0026EA684A|nr:penicillin acylase family protein [Sandarakinorhabdus limnophila]